MKHVKFTLVALFSASAALFVACASGNETEDAGGVGGHTTTTAGTGNGTTTQGPTGSGGGGAGGNGGSTTMGSSGCVPSCNIDADCQGTCAAPPAGSIYCCDVPNMMCFVSMTTPCPDSSSTSSSGNTGT